MKAWRRLVVMVAALLPGLAGAGYFQWDMVELPLSSGASCGNGTPYRFFVNRTPFTRNTVVVYEGGGACWDQLSCQGRGSMSASNPNGIPADYMSSIGNGLITPFTDRLGLFDRVQTQSWNMVYLPYCTGDVHAGSAVRTYADSDPANPRVQYFRGKANVTAAAQWLRERTGQPSRLLVTGFSAGGAGATATYMILRDTLAPTGRAQLLADSGPLFRAPRGSTPQLSPSLPLHEKVRREWGLDGSKGLLSLFRNRPGYDRNDLGSINSALAMRYPSDAFGYLLFRMDEVYPAFSYAKFHADVAAAPDGATRLQLMNQKWRQDIGQWLPALDAHANVGYHVAHWRSFNRSHCLTVVDFVNTGIEEKGVRDITGFIDRMIGRSNWPVRDVEMDEVSDYARPPSEGQRLLTRLLRLFG